MTGRLPTAVRPGRPSVSLLVAMVGYGLTFWAWTMIGSVPAMTVFAAIAVLVGSVGRIPVGVLTDRYGARVLLPAISVATALAVLLFAVAGSGPGLAGVAVALGVGGTTFAAGSALVVRAYRPARRGLALSVFGAGVGIASAAELLSRRLLAEDRRVVLPALALALIGYAVLAAVLVRDRPEPRARPGAHWRIAVDVLRLPATRYLSAWYAVAFGGLVAVGLYLPAFLRHVYALDGDRPVVYTAVCLTVAAAGRPVGGWLCQRHDPVPVLRDCFAGAALGGLVLAFEPPLAAVAVPALVGVAGCLGVASGAVQAVIGATVPPERAGAIAGTVGAVGGLAGLLPAVLLAVVYAVTGSYAIGLTLLAGAALAGAAYLWVNGPWLGAALAFPATIGRQRTATTLVALPAADTAHLAQTIAPLVTLATRQELVVVSSGTGGYPVVTGLRRHLPRHRVVAVAVGPNPHPHEVDLVADLLNDGALPVVLTTAANPDQVAVLLAGGLHADHVLHLTHDRIEGILLQPPFPLAAPSGPRGGAAA